MKVSLAKAPILLYSYLASEMLAPFFASFLIMNGVFFLVKLIPFLNFVLELNIDLPDFLRLFSYLFPKIFLYSIPMAAMLGVTIGFARLSSDTEILAFKASGISMYQILPPVLIVSAFIAILTGYVSVRLIPLSEIAMKQLTYQLMKEKVSAGIKEHVFTEALGDVVVYVDSIDKSTGEWQDVWVSDMRGVENPVITMASTGKMESSLEKMQISIVLRKGSLHRPSTEEAQIVQFDQYQINIPLHPPTTKATRLKRSALTMGELLQKSKDPDENEESRRKSLIEFHKRIVLPVGCLIISLIGLPLGLQARPGRKAIGIQAGLGIFILYYVIYTIGKTFAEEGVLPIGPAMWTPNLLFLVLAIFWIQRITNEQSLIPRSVTEFLAHLWEVAANRLKKSYRRAILRIKGQHEDDQSVEKYDIDSLNPTAIRGNAKSRVFHVPACEYYDCKNCTLEFKNIDIALDAGFEPCRFCKDLIEQ